MLNKVSRHQDYTPGKQMCLVRSDRVFYCAWQLEVYWL